ncbi:hypothetical protein WEH80_23935 [Actinomycetes bacterium KLBMP 9759]
MAGDGQQVPDRVHRLLVATGAELAFPHERADDTDLREIHAALQNFELLGGGAAFFEGAGQGVCLQLFHPGEGGVQAVGHDSSVDPVMIVGHSNSDRTPVFSRWSRPVEWDGG